MAELQQIKPFTDVNDESDKQPICSICNATMKSPKVPGDEQPICSICIAMMKSPAEVPEDKQRLLETEYIPQTGWSDQRVYPQATVVTHQPASQINQQPPPPSWVGKNYLVWISFFSLICCGVVLGLVALVLSWEAVNKRKEGKYKEAKWYTVLAFVFNIAAVVTGIAAITAAVVVQVLQIRNSLHYG